VIQHQQSDIISAYILPKAKNHFGTSWQCVWFRQQKRCALKSTPLYQLNHGSIQSPTKHLNSLFSPI